MVRFPLIIQGPSKRPSSGHLYPVSHVKECNRKGGNCKISRVLQLPVSSPQVSPKEKSELKPTQVFLFVGYEYHLDSALVKPTPERWLKLQDLILCLKSKHVLTVRCLMSLIGLLASKEKMVPEGMPSHEALSVSSQGALEKS